jgi:hypothetical protein
LPRIDQRLPPSRLAFQVGSVQSAAARYTT